MSAESKRWTCLICNTRQESVDRPRMEVCEDCLRPVAAKLCDEGLGVKLDSLGIDAEFWMRRADAVVGPMMRRWARARS